MSKAKLLDVLFTPAEYSVLPRRDLSGTWCVVFDVLRATSSMVTALGNGAQAIIPVAEIQEAVALKRVRPELMLAGEREGVRIRKEQTGSIDFDLGNSPREFVSERVRDRVIAMTTTNGTRALRACGHARRILVGSFLNMQATLEKLEQCEAAELLVVCSGTFEQAAYEDVLGAGCVCDAVWDRFGEGSITDSARMARLLYLREKADVAAGLGSGRNGRRLLARPELREDVLHCARLNAVPVSCEMLGDEVRRSPCR